MVSDRSASGKPEGRVLLEIFMVLLVVTALAMAVLPLLRGYIVDARQRQAADQCGSAVLSAQTLASEAYGLGKAAAPVSAAETAFFQRGDICTGQPISREAGRSQPFCDAVEYLSDAGGEVVSVTVGRDGIVIAMTFISSKDCTVYYRDGFYAFTAEADE